MDIHLSARRHGVADDDILHAITAVGDELIVHAMPLRAVYRKLLDR